MLGLLGSLLVLGAGCSSAEEPADGAAPPGGGGSGSGGSGGQAGSGPLGSLPVAGASSLPDVDDDDGPSSSGGSSSSAPDALPERVAAYLTSARATRLRIEIDAVDGLWPYASSKTYLGQFYAGLLDKPDGIELVEDETLDVSSADDEWTIEELDALARAHASEEGPTTITVQVLALPGRYAAEDGGTVLGVAWAHRFIALFQDSLRGNCDGGLLGGLQQDACEVAERNVWAHELGHVIGLVDNGVPMQTEHRDPDHGRHDRNEGCLMYWAYDRPQIFDTLLDRLGSGEGADLDLCDESRADLEAARAR
jgi:hypothetical protein